MGAGVLAASLGFFILHLQLLPDHLITLWLLSALWCWHRGLAAPTRLTEVGFFVCLTGGFFSKGLIGLVFPLTIVVLTALLAGRREGLRVLGSFPGWLLALLPAAGWLLLLEHRHPGFLWHFLFNEQVRRFLGAREPLDVQGFSLPAFWLLTLLWLMPWTPLLPAALAQAWRAAAGTGPHRLGSSLLLLWPAVILGFYSLSGCRVEYYTLPALPALALLVGWRLERGLALPRDRLLTAALLFLAGLALLAGLGLPSLEALLTANRREFAGLTVALHSLLPWGTLPLAMVALTGAWAERRRPRVALASLAGVGLGLLTAGFLSVTALSPYLGDRLPGEWVRQHARPGEMVVLDTVEEYEYAASLAWYAGFRVHLVVRGGLPRFPRPVPPAENYLLSPEDLERLWDSPRRVWVLVDTGVPPRKPWQDSEEVATFPGRHLHVNRASGDGCRGEGKGLSCRQFSSARPTPRETAGGSPGAARPGQPTSQ
jgi:4-amino-4-deoxy-L-arabinose transferase-like glycosyltransferase